MNSALQRARATLADADLTLADVDDPDDAEQQALVARYVDAFERYDMDSLTALLHEDATLSMPPYELWLQGPDDIAGWMLGQGNGCRGSRLVPSTANGSPAFGQYRPQPVRVGPRAVVADGARDRRRSGDGHQLVPRHRPPVPAVRPAAAPGCVHERLLGHQ